jgi:hypothetical protein
MNAKEVEEEEEKVPNLNIYKYKIFNSQTKLFFITQHADTPGGVSPTHIPDTCMLSSSSSLRHAKEPLTSLDALCHVPTIHSATSQHAEAWGMENKITQTKTRD